MSMLGCDDEVGESNSVGWYGRIGRAIVTEDSQGFFSWWAEDSVDVAKATMDRIAGELEAYMEEEAE